MLQSQLTTGAKCTKSLDSVFSSSNAAAASLPQSTIQPPASYRRDSDSTIDGINRISPIIPRSTLLDLAETADRAEPGYTPLPAMPHPFRPGPMTTRQYPQLPSHFNLATTPAGLSAATTMYTGTPTTMPYSTITPITNDSHYAMPMPVQHGLQSNFHQHQFLLGSSPQSANALTTNNIQPGPSTVATSGSSNGVFVNHSFEVPPPELQTPPTIEPIEAEAGQGRKKRPRKDHPVSYAESDEEQDENMVKPSTKRGRQPARGRPPTTRSRGGGRGQ
jgi:hypothetical protein